MKNMSSNESLISQAVYPYAERVFVAVAFSLASIFGIMGNSMVIISVLLCKKLQTRTNAFVVSLSFTDLLSSVALIPTIFALLGKRGWPLPGHEWLCSLSALFLYTWSGISLYTLAAIAINRMILITRPAMYSKIYSLIKISAMLFIIWIVPAMVILIPPLLNVGGLGYDYEDTTCTDLDQHAKSNIYNLLQALFFYPGPLIIIVVSYYITFWFIRQHFTSQRKSMSVAYSANSGQMFICENSKPDRQRLLRQQEIQITTNLFFVVVVFVLLFTPYFMTIIIPGGQRAVLFTGILVVCNGMVNPIIYSLKHPHFKVVVRAMLKGRLREIPEPSTLLLRLHPTSSV